MVESMPYEPSMPCAACAEGVDPLRARAVLALERGFRYFCSAECREAYRRADGSRRLRAAPEEPRPGLGARGEELAQVVPHVPAPPERAPAPEIALWPCFACVGAVGLSFLPGQLPAFAAAVSLTALAGVAAMRAQVQREESGVLAWIAAPVGVALLSLSAPFGEHRPALFSAAALGVLLIVARDFLALRARAPVDRLLSELREKVPARTRISVSDLSEGPSFATREGATASVRTGDAVVLEAGDVVPVDGVVAFGEATVLPFPGAREPVKRGPSDAVLAGARVVEGSLQVTATRVGSARALFRPTSFGQEGTPGSAQVTRAATRARSLLAGGLYVLFALALAALFSTEVGRTARGFGVALIAFPVLSLVRGVKLPFVSASALAASRGIVFRDAVTMERTGRISAAALSTDGTVTQGNCTLVEVSPLGRGQDHRELTALAMGAESVAEPHPLARAVRLFGEERGIEPVALRRAAYARGRGVTALADGGGPLVLGNRQSLLNAGVSVAVADREAQRAESEGRTVVFLAVGGRVRALFVFEDPVRIEARAAVQRLIDLDVEVVLLSGDHRATVEAVARTLDITHVKAELTSEERGAEVGRLREAGGVVAVIGRAPADELALAAADIALTLDAAGSSLEGDVAVASGDLRDAADALVIARRARRAAQTTLAVALGGGALLAAAGALGVLHPILVLSLAFGIDAWAMPGAARLLRRTRMRPRIGRSPLSGFFRRA